jgi:hypothetical protein
LCQPHCTYLVDQARFVVNETVLEKERQQAGRFILASNILDQEQLNNDALLSEYKQHLTSVSTCLRKSRNILILLPVRLSDLHLKYKRYIAELISPLVLFAIVAVTLPRCNFR